MFKVTLIMILTLFLAACASAKPPASQAQGTSTGKDETAIETKPLSEEAQPVRADLEDLGPAPELENEVWLNTEAPLRLEELSGKVILLDMWTFG